MKIDWFYLCCIVVVIALTGSTAYTAKVETDCRITAAHAGVTNPIELCKQN